MIKLSVITSFDLRSKRTLAKVDQKKQPLVVLNGQSGTSILGMLNKLKVFTVIHLKINYIYNFVRKLTGISIRNITLIECNIPQKKKY